MFGLTDVGIVVVLIQTQDKIKHYMVGYLYIVNNMEMYGWGCFKIGFTSDLKQRLEDFNSSTINIGKFVEIGHIFCKDAELVEKKVHEDLNSFRVRQNREFFDCDIGLVNLSILKNSKDTILENHLKYRYFCTPQGSKYEIFFNKLEKFATYKNIEPPKKPENNCVAGSFCGCTSYPGKSFQGHFKNWGRILNWVNKNYFKDELDKFLISLNDDDIVYHSDPYPNDQGID